MPPVVERQDDALGWWVASELRSHRSSINCVSFFPPLLLHSSLPSPSSGLSLTFIYNGLYSAIEHSRFPRCARYPSAVHRLHWLPQLLDRKDPGPHHPPELYQQSLIHQLQSLKETFAAKLPGEIEKIKKLRKYAPPTAGPLPQR